ncbi:MAG: nucleotidyltransferase family protein [Acidobacteriota bacterium]
MSDPPIAAVILAAGLSRRLGRPKQSIVLAGETLVERSIRITQEAGLSPVLVVLVDSDLIESVQARGAFALLNRNTWEGLATSIHVGIDWARGIQAAGVVLMTCDQPAVQPEHLRALIEEPSVAVGSAYAGKIGVPAYFPSSSFPALLQLQGDTGARDLLRYARSIHTEDLAFDIDTEADVELAQSRFDV